MFRNNPFAGTPTYKLIVGLGLCTLSGAVMYIYLRNRDGDEESDETGTPRPIAQKKQPKEVVIKLTISNDKIPLVVGRAGSNLSAIEDQTRTKIHFRDKNDTQKTCEIIGLPDDAKSARSLLLKEIERSPIVKEEVYVPKSACGKIIGRCGEAMQEICRISKAKVSVDSGGRNNDGDKRLITITGNRQQVNIARKLIEAKIEEDIASRRTVEEMEQHREPRRSPTNSISSSLYSSQTSLSSHLPPREKMLAAKADDKPMDVYVSAIASPAKFWVQLIGPQLKKLDDLVETMTNYYNTEDNRKLHKINEPYLGQIVASIYRYDGKWYRGEIVSILPNEYNPEEIALDIYYVDYGDSSFLYPHEIFELRTDFLTLRFQAVECFLANIKPKDNSDNWSKQSVERLEELTQVAQWRKLTSRVVTYKERPKAIGGQEPSTAGIREGSPVPGVELYDLADGMEININHAMIANGCALSLDDHPGSRSATASPETSLYGHTDSLSHSPTPTNENTTSTPLRSTEDEVIAEQLKKMKKPANVVLSNGDSAVNDTKKLTAEFLNGNSVRTQATNGNVSR